ncbi:hypothetical protein ACOSP7_000685 [Xanthoceras sorbifolium]
MPMSITRLSLTKLSLESVKRVTAITAPELSLTDYTRLLESCIQSKTLTEGKKIHQHLLKNNNSHINNPFILQKLAHLYVSCNEIELAHRLFDTIPQPNVVFYNLMIRAYAWNGPFERALDLYYKMLHSGITPTKFTFPFVLKACSGLQAIEDGREIHVHAKRLDLDSDIYICTALIDLYAKCGDLDQAKWVFDGMSCRDVVAWNAMIAGFSLHGLYDHTIQLFIEMQKEGINPNSSTIVAVLPTVAGANDISNASRIFNLIDVKNGVTWSAIIGAYVTCEFMREALQLYDRMMIENARNLTPALHIFHEMQLSGIEPDLATMVSVLPTCSHLVASQHGACGHGFSIVRGFIADTSICNALIDMYSKCGKIDFAKKVFDSMDRRDIVSWNAMIDGYGIHGLGKEALLLFSQMNAVGLKPDDVTFICLLSSCSHSRLVTEGKQLFNYMIQGLNIVPKMDHYICMVDLLARSGHLDEACKFIDKMPFEPDVHVWGALLAACRIYKNVELGEEISKKIQMLEPEGTGNFVLLSNMYSTVSRWDDAAHVRIMQRDQGFKKSAGCSWVEVNGVIHAFVGGDRSHPQSKQINEKLDELLVEMTSLRSSKPILVTKNLRVCADCHAFQRER